MSVDKKAVIAKLQEYIKVLEDENTRLENVRIGNAPVYDEITLEGKIFEFSKSGENFDIDFDVSYIKNVDV